VSFEYVGLFKSKLLLTYLSRRLSVGMELAPCPKIIYLKGQVAKASSGHFPQPFLISFPILSGCKELLQR